MLIDLESLVQELPALRGRDVADVRDLLAGLGFPVDASTEVEGGWVLDVDITANRGDAQSHRGMARDLAARLDAVLAPLPVARLQEGPAIRPISLDAVACSLYATAVLELPRVVGTPDTVRTFLSHLELGAKGLTPVDASNELLHRYGHPTHAFDEAKLTGAVAVRWAKAGERLVTLDGVDRALMEQDLVIADASGPIALAGVMGGEATKVTETTTRVLLESAWFDARVVRAMARRHGLHTDASHRFGRGADPAMATIARDLLADRLMTWSGATLVGAWTVGILPAARPAIRLTPAVLNRIAGEEILLAEAQGYLKRLGCAVHAEPGSLQVEPPSWRHDLTIPEDLAEEVLRLRGYDRIPSALPGLEGEPVPLSAEFQHRRRVARRLAAQGFHQCVTLGFVSPDMDGRESDRSGRTLVNPLGQEYSVMRSSLLPSLAEVLMRNLAQGQKEVKLFELAPVYAIEGGRVQERASLALVWAGMRGGEDPLSRASSVDTDGQLLLQGVLRDLGVPATVQAGRISPWVGAQDADALRRAWGVEVLLDQIPMEPERVIPTFRPFSRHPAMERDLSLLVDLGCPYARLEAGLQEALDGVSELRAIQCVDVFRHKSLPAGRQALLVRLRFQADDRTLRGDEVDAWVALALAGAEKVGAALRS